jgi:hypothetical protein
VVIVTTDRQSAFDRLLACIPFKGQARGAGSFVGGCCLLGFCCGGRWAEELGAVAEVAEFRRGSLPGRLDGGKEERRPS